MNGLKVSLAVTLISVTCLAASSSYANAKYHHMGAPAQTAPNTASAQIPSAAPAHVGEAVKEHVSLREVNFANFTKPDTNLADQIIESFNKKDMSLFQSTLVKTGYMVITPFDNEVNNETGMKTFWQEMFGEHGCLKSVNFSGTHGEIQAPYPGVATLSTKLKFTNEGKETQGLMDIMMKYEADGWKIASLHFTSYDLVKHMTFKEAKRTVEQEFLHRQSKQMGLFFPFACGLVIGSAIMAAYSKRKKKDHRK